MALKTTLKRKVFNIPEERNNGNLKQKKAESLDKGRYREYNDRAAIEKTGLYAMKERCMENGKNISAEKAPTAEGARFPEENADGKRQKSIAQTPCEGQSKAQLLNIKQNHRRRRKKQIGVFCCWKRKD